MKKGFTLIELLVVISIISLLSSVLLTSFNTVRARGRDTKRLADLHQVVNALELYRIQNGSYPTCAAGWCSGCANATALSPVLDPLVSQGFIKELPLDPKYDSTICQNYEYFSTSSPAFAGGIYQCTALNGVNEDIINYSYGIRFRLETMKVNLPKFVIQRLDSAGNGTEYCILGPK